MAVFPNVALMGRARAGKDSVGATLQQRYCYTRVSFADPLKDMALQVDPIIVSEEDRLDYGGGPLRLAEIVRSAGWENAKDEHPEVRRILQNVGQTVREHDEDFWLRIALAKIEVAAGWGMPVVVTDVRYPNEYAALVVAGFKMVRVVRPSRRSAILAEAGIAHESETAIEDYKADVKILNSGTLTDLRNAAEALARVTDTGIRIPCPTCEATFPTLSALVDHNEHAH